MAELGLSSCLHRSGWTLADLGISSSSSSSSSSHSSDSIASASPVHGPVLSLDRLHVTTVDNFWALAIAAHYSSTVRPLFLNACCTEGSRHADASMRNRSHVPGMHCPLLDSRDGHAPSSMEPC